MVRLAYGHFAFLYVPNVPIHVLNWRIIYIFSQNLSNLDLTPSLSFSPIWNCRLKLSMLLKRVSTGVCMEILNWFFWWPSSKETLSSKDFRRKVGLRIEKKKGGYERGDLNPYGLPHWILYREWILAFY
jgi:hypothetical protein